MAHNNPLPFIIIDWQMTRESLSTNRISRRKHRNSQYLPLLKINSNSTIVKPVEHVLAASQRHKRYIYSKKKLIVITHNQNSPLDSHLRNLAGVFHRQFLSKRIFYINAANMCHLLRGRKYGDCKRADDVDGKHTTENICKE